jgi:hypothetical protein
MTISWAADNAGTAGVFLNGVAIPGSSTPRNSTFPTSEPWAHFTTFTIDSSTSYSTGTEWVFGHANGQ